jgi:hypothetical protein
MTFRYWWHIQASALTFVRLSGTSENWRRTSRSCITVVRRDKCKNLIPKRAGTTDKSISTGIKYWVCCIKESCLISNLSVIQTSETSVRNMTVELESRHPLLPKTGWGKWRFDSDLKKKKMETFADTSPFNAGVKEKNTKTNKIVNLQGSRSSDYTITAMVQCSNL